MDRRDGLLVGDRFAARARGRDRLDSIDEWIHRASLVTTGGKTYLLASPITQNAQFGKHDAGMRSLPSDQFVECGHTPDVERRTSDGQVRARSSKHSERRVLVYPARYRQWDQFRRNQPGQLASDTDSRVACSATLEYAARIAIRGLSRVSAMDAWDSWPGSAPKIDTRCSARRHRIGSGHRRSRPPPGKTRRRARHAREWVSFAIAGMTRITTTGLDRHPPFAPDDEVAPLKDLPSGTIWWLSSP